MSLKSKITILLVFIFYSFLNPVCSNGESNHPDRFYQKLSNLCWVAYAPTNFNPSQKIYPPESSIREDLVRLKKNGFNGIVTFGSEKTLGRIPKVANELGFVGIIMGIWKIDSQEEVRQAIAARDYVDAYCVGHMGLNRRYNLETLRQMVSELKRNTGRPISISESIPLYKKDSEIIEVGDWIFPDARLYWKKTGATTPGQLFQQLIEDYERLVGISKKPVLIKTVGFPTGGASGATEDNQEKFFGFLFKNAKHPAERVRFVYHEAFDQPWKIDLHPVEPHWGIFNSVRNSKKGSKFIWGQHVTYSLTKLQPIIKHHLYNINNALEYIVISIIVIIFVLFLWFRKRSKRLKLVVKDKKIFYGCVELLFPNKHDECFNIFLLLCKDLEKPILCGEILKKTNNDPSSGCTFSEEGGCDGKSEKKGLCNAYKSLNTHRIRHIKNMLKDNNIGVIENIKRQSQWKLVLNTGINLKIKSATSG